MKTFLSIAVLLVSAAFLAGCTADQPQLTKAQQDVLKNKQTAPAGYKGPDKAGLAKMNTQIQKYNDEHKNDKVTFDSSPGAATGN